jgi:hypothetical protein
MIGCVRKLSQETRKTLSTRHDADLHLCQWVESQPTLTAVVMFGVQGYYAKRLWTVSFVSESPATLPPWPSGSQGYKQLVY